jgi:O-antigen ligase
MLTASRAGFLDLVVAGTVGLWLFGVKGKRLYLIIAAGVVVVLLLRVAGRNLERRFAVVAGATVSSRLELSAEGSFEERKLLMARAVDAIVHYPILGVGVGDFVVYSGLWKEVHASYLQIAAEGGIPVLILYLTFFSCGFANLRRLMRTYNLDPEANLFACALKSSLVGFVVGACFAPEAYQFFPYFAVCYTSVLLAIVEERQPTKVSATRVSRARPRRLAVAY